MKSVLRGIILFFITFVTGSLFASLYFSKKERTVKPQQFSNNSSQVKSYDLPKCIDPTVELHQMRADLLRETSNLITLLESNGISKQQKSETEKKLLSKKKEIEEVETRIKDWEIRKQFRRENPKNGNLAVKLLHKEPCYDLRDEL